MGPRIKTTVWVYVLMWTYETHVIGDVNVCGEFLSFLSTAEILNRKIFTSSLAVYVLKRKKPTLEYR